MKNYNGVSLIVNIANHKYKYYMEYILQSFSDQYNNQILNYFSFLSIIFGIYTIISKNPIISVLFLIGLFTSVAIHLILSGLIFMGLSYLLVYVGAISILFIFILMLINIRISELITETNNSLPLALLTILIFNIVYYNIIPSSIGNVNMVNIDYLYNSINSTLNYIASTQIYALDEVKKIENLHWDNILVNIPHISSIGNVLYTVYFIHFLILSLILLLAMIGAILITINRKS